MSNHLSTFLRKVGLSPLWNTDHDQFRWNRLCEFRQIKRTCSGAATVNWIAAVNNLRATIVRPSKISILPREQIPPPPPAQTVTAQASVEMPDHNTRTPVRSVDRIHRIARHLNAKSYLEIGVSRGATFRRVQLPRKVGVDPCFRFEVSDVAREGVQLYSMTSDAYFTSVPNLPQFDVIFLDGLHTFQQTFRDFCNSLTCAHNGTVWLIDDVMPNDVFSALPIQREAIEFRRKSDPNAFPYWHGDVFKVLFAIHDFFPTLSYVTLIGDANPQAIVWKAPRTAFKPLFNSLERIERLGYFDLLKRQDALNGMLEDEGFEAFFSSVRDTQSGGP